MIKVVIQNMDSVHLSGSARRVKSQARRRFSSSYPVNDRIGRLRMAKTPCSLPRLREPRHQAQGQDANRPGGLVRIAQASTEVSL